MMANERSQLLQGTLTESQSQGSSMSRQENDQCRRRSGSAGGVSMSWTGICVLVVASLAVGATFAGVAVAVFMSPSTSSSAESAVATKETVSLLGSSKKMNPALQYFAKAQSEFPPTMPLLEGRDNSFLADLVISADKKMPITSGFYLQESGDELVYEYTYHEMKIIVAGEFHVSDDQGNTVVATPGDVFYFPKGSVITFSSPSFGLGFFCGQRGPGEA